MNATSAFPAEGPAAPAAPAAQRVLVWDAPVRVFHWFAVLCFAGAWLTAESERFRLLHVTLGYTLAGLVAFRVLWGLVGTRHARFASFVRGPAAVRAYLAELLRGRHPRHAGHNPAGALAIVGLLTLAAAVTGSGWSLYNDLGGEWLEDLHEAAASIMLGLAGVHVAGVVLASWMGRENLVRAMFSGHKQAASQEAIRSAWRSVAALMVVAVAGFWFWQWQGAPQGGSLDGAQATTQVEPGGRAGRRAHDGDQD